MKKLVLATLLAAATGLASAQSVNFYGFMDLGYGSIDNVGSTKGRVTGLQNGGITTSRLGIKGEEDLGGGLKANFNLEAELLADNGGQQSTADALFGRASWVGLSSNQLGSVKLGRINTNQYSTIGKFDPMGGNNFGSVYTSDYGNARINNAVTIETPAFAGFRANFQTGTATASTTTGAVDEVVGNYNANRIKSYALYFDQGAFSAAGIYETKNASSSARSTTSKSGFASYDFGSVKVTGGVIAVNTESTDVTVTKYFAGVQVPVAARVRVNAIAQQVNNQTAEGLKPRAYAAMGIYDLSKRTALYAGVARSDQDGASTLNLVSTTKWSYTDGSGARVAGVGPAAGQNQTAYTVGMRHSF